MLEGQAMCLVAADANMLRASHKYNEHQNTGTHAGIPHRSQAKKRRMARQRARGSSHTPPRFFMQKASHK